MKPLICPLLISVIIVLSSSERVKKASKSNLNKVRERINDESARRHSAVQSDSIDFFADVRRDPRERRHHDELVVNNVEDYFQGDVDLSENQVEVILRTLESTLLETDSVKRTKRKIGKTPLYKRWKKRQPISFEFAPEIPPVTRNKIRNAMRLWQANTCIRFEENGPTVDRLEFFDGGGCSSFVGRIGGTQGISISTPGCDVVGIISHEIGHALGIFHEQARPDQERYVSVNYNNIPISRWNNFQPVDENHADLLGLPYDTGSVMHYGPYGFSADPYVPTIRTLDRNLQKTIGQRAGPAFLDFQAINLAYDCTEHCQTKPDCQRGGYVHPNNCSTCLCPDGLAGTECANIRLSNGPCGGVLRATPVHGFISTPNYPNEYMVNTECYWMIQAPPGGRVFLEIDPEMEFAICEDTCDKSYVEVKYNADLRLTGARFCCPGAPRKPFVSHTNEMLVIMRGFGGTAKGFQAHFWTDSEDGGANALNVHSTPRPALQLSTTPSPPIVTPLLPIPFTLPPPIMTTTRWEETTTTRMPPMLSTPRTPTPIRPITTAVSLPHTTTPAPPEEKLIPVHDCGCKVWTEWEGRCTQQCGGCGSRQRKRVCMKQDTCQTTEKRPCNFDACPEGTNFLLNNGEVHLLWRGCCIGLFRQGDNCAALEANANPLLSFFSELLKTNDAYGPQQGGEAPLEGAAIRSRKRL